jgi:hypothetical protein
MLRILAFALVLGAPSLAMAQQFPDSPLEQEVRGHDGAVIGRITAVERNADGDIVAVEIPGLEPADAPAAALVAENERERGVNVRQRRQERSGAGSAEIRIR